MIGISANTPKICTLPPRNTFSLRNGTALSMSATFLRPNTISPLTLHPTSCKQITRVPFFPCFQSLLSRSDCPFAIRKFVSKAALEQLNGKIQRNVIILLLKPFSPRMPQNPRQPSAHSTYAAKREFHSLKYKEISHNTPPFYAIPALNASLHRDKFKKDTEKHSDSFETCESEGASYTERSSYHGRENKIKVELCKNFVEKGYCPYENRCKFAHGIEELRAKDTWGNSELYRTRKCKVFYEKHECKFGERCNFMHENRKIGQIMTVNNRALRQAIRMNFQQISFEGYTARVQSSRLMGLLQGNEADNNI